MIVAPMIIAIVLLFFLILTIVKQVESERSRKMLELALKQVKSEKKRQKVELALGPWRKCCGNYNLSERNDCDKAAESFAQFMSISSDVPKDILCTVMYALDHTTGHYWKNVEGGVTPFRKLALNTINIANHREYDRWRDDYSIPSHNMDLYQTCAYLEVFIIKSSESILTIAGKERVAKALLDIAPFQNAMMRDFIYLTVVALRYDDLLYDHSYEYGDFVNYDCIMWGAKKVCELITREVTDHSDDFRPSEPETKEEQKEAPNSKTKKCSKYQHYKNKRKRRRENEQKTREQQNG